MREASKFVFCLSTLVKLDEGGPKYCFMFNMLIILDEGGIIFCFSFNVRMQVGVRG